MAVSNSLKLFDRWQSLHTSSSATASPLPRSPIPGRTSPPPLHSPLDPNTSLAAMADSLRDATKHDFAMPGVDKLILGPVYIGNALFHYISALASQEGSSEQRLRTQSEALSKLMTAISSFVYSIERFSLLITNFASGFTAFSVSTLTIVLGSFICIFEGSYQSIQLFHQINFHRDLVFRSFYGIDPNDKADFETLKKRIQKLELLIQSHSKPFIKIFGQDIFDALKIEVERIKSITAESECREAYKRLVYKIKLETVHRDLSHLLEKHVTNRKPAAEENEIHWFSNRNQLVWLANRVEPWLAIEIANRCTTRGVKIHRMEMARTQLSYHWDQNENIVEHDSQGRQTRIDDPLQVEAAGHLLIQSDGTYTDPTGNPILNSGQQLLPQGIRYSQSIHGTIERISLLDRLITTPIPRAASRDSVHGELSSSLDDVPSLSGAGGDNIPLPPTPTFFETIMLDAVDEGSELMEQVFIQSKKKILIHSLALSCILLTAISLLSATFLFPPGIIIGMSVASTLIGFTRGLACGGMLSQRGWNFHLGKGGYFAHWICDVIGEVAKFFHLYQDSTICNQRLNLARVMAKA